MTPVLRRRSIELQMHDYIRSVIVERHLFFVLKRKAACSPSSTISKVKLNAIRRMPGKRLLKRPIMVKSPIWATSQMR